MTTLNRRAKELIAEVGDSDGPTAAEKADLRAAVLARVGATAVTGAAAGGAAKTLSANAAKVSAAAAWSKGLVVLGIVAVAGVGYLGVSGVPRAKRGSDPVVAAPGPANGPAAAPSPAVPARPPEVAPDPVTPAVASKVAVVASSRPLPVARPGADPDVEAETAGLASVLSTLRDRGAADALAGLDRENARFPHGALTEERAATRIDLLCALGQKSDARAAGARFLREHPRSLLSARVSASCGAP